MMWDQYNGNVVFALQTGCYVSHPPTKSYYVDGANPWELTNEWSSGYGKIPVTVSAVSVTHRGIKVTSGIRINHSRL